MEIILKALRIPEKTLLKKGEVKNDGENDH